MGSNVSTLAIFVANLRPCWCSRIKDYIGLEPGSTLYLRSSDFAFLHSEAGYEETNSPDCWRREARRSILCNSASASSWRAPDARQGQMKSRDDSCFCAHLISPCTRPRLSSALHLNRTRTVQYGCIETATYQGPAIHYTTITAVFRWCIGYLTKVSKNTMNYQTLSCWLVLVMRQHYVRKKKKIS